MAQGVPSDRGLIGMLEWSSRKCYLPPNFTLRPFAELEQPRVKRE